MYTVAHTIVGIARTMMIDVQGMFPPMRQFERPVDEFVRTGRRSRRRAASSMVTAGYGG